MTYERAVYFRLLLLCGYSEELYDAVEKALMEEDPLSDIILSLSFIGSDDKKALSVLNEYILQVKDTQIDYDHAVFDYVLSFLKKKYEDASLSMQSIADLMYRIALHTQRHFDEPWYTMYVMGDLFEEAEAGFIDKADFQKRFEAFIQHQTPLRDDPPANPYLPPKVGSFKRLAVKIRSGLEKLTRLDHKTRR